MFDSFVALVHEPLATWLVSDAKGVLETYALTHWPTAFLIEPAAVTTHGCDTSATKTVATFAQLLLPLIITVPLGGVVQLLN